MQKSITLKVSEEALRWARHKAADENTSVSRLVGKMLEEMRRTDDYWQAYERWKLIKGVGCEGAAARASREETHERGNRG